MCSLNNIRRNDNVRANRSSQKRTLDITPEQRAALYETISRIRGQIHTRSLSQSGQEQDAQTVQDALRPGCCDDTGSDDRQRLGDMRGSPEQNDDSRNIAEMLRRGRRVRLDEKIQRNDNDKRASFLRISGIGRHMNYT